MEDTTKDPVENNQPQDDNVTKVKLPSQTEDDNVTKVDLSKPIENETEENNVDPPGVEAGTENADPAQEQEKVQQEEETQETHPSALEEVTEEEIEEVAEKVEEVIAEAEATGKPLPESVQKLLDFMEETGGDLADYTRLNKDYSQLDEKSLLREYYKQTKPHLDNSEIDFLMEENFAYDEELDDERDIRKKQIAQKEQVASAKTYLDGLKSKYYEEIKAGSKLTAEQQKAIDFFNRYNKESEANQKQAEKATEVFNSKTNNLFNDKFKGFEYNVGDKKYRFNVKNTEEVKTTQSDINNFIGKFLDENNIISDAKGYHKSLFTAMNADAIAKHFYEQGKADATKESIKNAKNVDMTPRQSHGKVEVGGLKFKVLGDDANDLKFKIKK